MKRRFLFEAAFSDIVELLCAPSAWAVRARCSPLGSVPIYAEMPSHSDRTRDLPARQRRDKTPKCAVPSSGADGVLRRRRHIQRLRLKRPIALVTHCPLHLEPGRLGERLKKGAEESRLRVRPHADCVVYVAPHYTSTRGFRRFYSVRLHFLC